MQKELDKRLSGVRKWVEFSRNYALTQNIDQNKRALAEDVKKVLALIDVLDAHPEKNLILVPDTNTLLDFQDPSAYSAIGGKSFTLLLLPTVVGELDNLKTLHRVETVREKARKMIRRIKGWRAQGSLLNGVTTNQTITIRQVAQEPKISASLSWLDGAVNDDRIIAAVLEIQADHPAANVVLVTGDLNLQTKAEAAMIAYNDLHR